jgi:ribosome maturation factor RimP
MELGLSQLEKKLTEMLEAPVEAIGFELVGVEFVRAGKHSTLRIYIDSENGIEVDDCADVSRQVSAVLDVEDPISTEYNLEVSSPGMDRPLFKPEHYKQVLAQTITVKLQMPQDDRRNFKGLLESCDERGFTMIVDKQKFELAYDNVLKANLVPEFD